MSPQPTSQTSVLDGGRMGTLQFRWDGDRFTHRWEFESDGERVSLTSMDAMTASGCCTSPPLQQIHAQDFGDGRRVIFGVGMAGRGHWSASFTLVPELESWIVELACRSPVAPTWLGNTYQADDRWVANDNQGGLQRLCGGKRLELQPIAPSSRVEMDAGTIRVLPQQILPGAATTQWAFRLRVLD